MSFDLSRWAIVGHNDDTGIGRQASDAKAVLGVRQIAIPSENLATKPLGPGDVLLPPNAATGEVEAALRGLQGIITIERIGWHPELLAVARRLGVRFVVVPNWEWFRGTDREWGMVDALVCPSDFTRRIVESYGWKHARVVTWAFDLTRVPSRRISGPARVFFHNAGLVNEDDRKSTRETIRAFRRVRRRDVRLIVRLQREVPLPPLDERIDLRIGNLAETAELYGEGDVAVQPSKMEGCGFLVIEPVSAGLPTLTTDYPPMSDYVRQPHMRVRKRWWRRKALPARIAGVRHAHLRLPSERDLARKIEWCAAHDLSEISRANRAWAEETFNRDRLRRLWSEALAALL